jgi:hypothetical protein
MLRHRRHHRETVLLIPHPEDDRPGEKRIGVVTLVFIIALVVAMVAFMWNAGARAHNAPSGMAYPSGCCNSWKPDGSGDCAPIPASSVKATPGGWVITIAPGEHPLATKPHVFTKDFGKELPSSDGSYHLCLYPTENEARCFLAPEPGA